MYKQTIRDIDVGAKTVIVRVDFNVPLDETGQIEDAFRIEAALPTIQYLLDQDCKLVLISHLGRPDGEKNKKYSLSPTASALADVIGEEVEFIDDCLKDIGEWKTRIKLLENLRFYPEEEKNDADFAQKLSRNGEIFVQDGFAVVHRAHASTDAITKFLPSVAGLLLENEVSTIKNAVEHPEKPVVTIIAGAKLETKLELIESFIDISDHLIIGGAMANTFLKAMGYEIGKSLYDDTLVDTARTLITEIKAAGVTLGLPLDDVAVARSVDASADRREIMTTNVEEDDIILDFGSSSASRVANVISDAKTVFWNGPIGMFELPKFAEASMVIAHKIAESGATSIVGGGDTANFIREYEMTDKFSFISTGGGASLELMAGRKLPGLEALLDKAR